MLVRLFAMFKGRSGMLLRFFVLAHLVVMRGLVMMMHGRVVVGGGLVMMLARRMLRHYMVLHGMNGFLKPMRSGYSLTSAIELSDGPNLGVVEVRKLGPCFPCRPVGNGGSL
jgi:hypothetical protein